MTSDDRKDRPSATAPDRGPPSASSSVNRTGRRVRWRAPRISSDIVSFARSVASGALNEAEIAAALEKFRPQFEELEAFRKTLPPEPPAKIGKTIPMWFAGEAKPIDFVALLNETLRSVGYAPAGREAADGLNVCGFRADWSSSEVEHFLAFQSWGRPNQFIVATVSLGNAPAEAFANATMLRYLPLSYREIYVRLPIWQRALHFELGDVAGWPRSRLDSSTTALSKFPQTVVMAVRQYVVARVQNVCDCAALFELAISDKAPFPWLSWGDRSRVAMAIYLGRKLGYDSALLKATLVSRVGAFESRPGAPAPSAGEFVDHTLAEADEALRAAAE